MDLNEEPARESSCTVNLNEVPTWDSSSDIDLNDAPTWDNESGIDLNDVPTWNNESGIDLNEPPIPEGLKNEIPEIFHSYVTQIQDVRGDGNCGFRSIAVCLGYNEDQWLYIRQELLAELNNKHQIYRQIFGQGFDELYHSLNFFSSPAPYRHWMILPDTGILVANRFGVIFHSLSIHGSRTIFPLWRGPHDVRHHQTCTIAHVYGNHYVMVQLQGDYPMPRIITGYCSQRRYPKVAEWKAAYISRFGLDDYNVGCDFVDLDD